MGLFGFGKNKEKVSRNTAPKKSSSKSVKKPVKKTISKKSIPKKIVKKPVKKTISKKSIKKPVKKIIKKRVVKKPTKKIISKKQTKIPLKHAEEKIKEQRKHAKKLKTSNSKTKVAKKEVVKTGVSGLDELLLKGIPRGSSILVAGGAGSGKTILCLQTLAYNVKKGKKCLYVSFEESEKRLISHMEDFKLNPIENIKAKKLEIKRFNPFDIARSVDALLLKAKGELLIDIDPILFPVQFNPEIVIIDSLTAIASAFVGKEDSYRIYIEQLFRFFEKLKATVFLITETAQVPTTYSTTGVEEFLADGVFVLYNIQRGNIRERAIEVLKLRGADHQKKIVTFEITEKGLVVYPSQELFEDIHT